eukprot:jgi/Mesvir1/25005/Mv16960-RA.1
MISCTRIMPRHLPSVSPSPDTISHDLLYKDNAVPSARYSWTVPKECRCGKWSIWVCGACKVGKMKADHFIGGVPCKGFVLSRQVGLIILRFVSAR